ncbi:MAG: DUF5615 family PIN-like protein [Candidatus Xenobia bacterium]
MADEGLFISLYLDEDVDVKLANLLRARGYDAITTRDASNLNAEDSAQLDWATQQGRAIMTHNRVDYENLAKVYWGSGRRHCGIIIAPQGTPHELLERLVLLLDERTAEDAENLLLYI